MPVKHRLLALCVAISWGINFLAIHLSLKQFPPFFLVTMRWIVLAIPALIWVSRPKVRLKYLLGYGLGFGCLQFAFLYAAMNVGMPTGLASLVLQSSAPFTVVLGGLFARERLTPARAAGVVIAVGGLAIVGSQHTGGATWLPFVLTVLAGLSWAFGNLAVRFAAPEQPLQLTMWMAVIPPVPMLVLSLATEGPQRIWASLSTTTHAVEAWAGLAYTALIATVIGNGIWTWLMARHPASVVAPYSMLVPVVGLTVAAVVLSERRTAVELIGCGTVVAGVLLTSLTRPRRLRLRRSAPA